MTACAIRDALPYRPCAGVMLFNRAGDVFIGKRIDSTDETWQMPQGGIDEGEEPHVAAFRELREEIGSDRAEIIAEATAWLQYDLPEELIGKLWDGCYRGQRQKWFAMRFLGEDRDIKLDTEHPEFRDWRWTPLHTLPDLIVPFKRDLYRRLVAEFAHLAVPR